MSASLKSGRKWQKMAGFRRGFPANSRWLGVIRTPTFSSCTAHATPKRNPHADSMLCGLVSRSVGRVLAHEFIALDRRADGGGRRGLCQFFGRRPKNCSPAVYFLLSTFLCRPPSQNRSNRQFCFHPYDVRARRIAATATRRARPLSIYTGKEGYCALSKGPNRSMFKQAFGLRSDKVCNTQPGAQRAFWRPSNGILARLARACPI